MDSVPHEWGETFIPEPVRQMPGIDHLQVLEVASRPLACLPSPGLSGHIEFPDDTFPREPGPREVNGVDDV